MSAQADSSDEIQQEETEPEDILQKIDLSGIDDWEPKMQQEDQDLICNYACIFSQNDLDLGKTSAMSLGHILNVHLKLMYTHLLCSNDFSL